VILREVIAPMVHDSSATSNSNINLSRMLSSPLSGVERESLCALLFPDLGALPTLSALESRYVARTLSPAAMITRFAPSPTGFMHLGAVYAALINYRFASQTGGKFLLRIEATDQKRKVEGAFNLIVESLEMFGLIPDEGFIPAKTIGTINEVGDYGPYQQSSRVALYRAHVAHLIREGLAYPCFASESQLKEMQEQQQLERQRPGYYGRWAIWRDSPFHQLKDSIEQGIPFVIRFRSSGDYNKRISWKDSIHEVMHQPENDLDAVLLKSDGTSLYHLAHVVDDHFMRVTHVIRGDEWLSSVPLHLQLFAAFGYAPPVYSHLAPIQKLEVGEEEVDGEILRRESRRKLSKRKDPEASVSYYVEHGYPPASVLEYLLHIADSSFEEWRLNYPNASWADYALKFQNFSRSGALVDLEKLQSVSRDVVARMDTEVLYHEAVNWCKQFDSEFADIMEADGLYTRAALDIERTGDKASKRIASWRDLRPQLWWFYDELFVNHHAFPYPKVFTGAELVDILDNFIVRYDGLADKDAWFLMCQKVAEDLKYAPTIKLFKKNPNVFKAHIGDLTMVIRVAISGLERTPDLFQMLQVMGVDRVRARISGAIERIKNEVS